MTQEKTERSARPALIHRAIVAHLRGDYPTYREALDRLEALTDGTDGV